MKDRKDMKEMKEMKEMTNRKRSIQFLCVPALLLILILSLSGCGEKSQARKSGNASLRVDDVLKMGMSEADRKEKGSVKETEPSSEEMDIQEFMELMETLPAEEVDAAFSPATEAAIETESEIPNGSVQADPAIGKPDPGSIDVDLTAMSGNMVYAEVLNMLTSPEDYVGKTVKMAGSFSCYHDDASGNTCYACLVKDATACCAEGIEFELAGDAVYPDDYPKPGSQFSVIGVFDSCREKEYSYCTLRNAELM